MKFLFGFILVLSFHCAMALPPAEAETAIADLHAKISQAGTKEEGDSISNLMRSLFIGAFDDPKTFDYPFEKFQFCKLISKDHHIRLFNWNLPYPDGTHTYFCFVLVCSNL